jgi:Domain of unknown function (DUF4907)
MKSTTSRINPKYYNYIGIGLLIAIGLVLYGGHYFRQKKAREYVYLEAKAIQSQYGWGYDILAEGKLYIHQEFIPAISGRKGFETKEQALLVGNKVIAKIRNKEVPPTLTIQELKELGVIKDSFAIK